MLRNFLVVSAACALLLCSTVARAGLYETLQEPDEAPRAAAPPARPTGVPWETTPDAPPARPEWKKLLDGLPISPILLLRASFVHTLLDRHKTTDPDGNPVSLDSRKMPATQYGHVRGFVLDNAELGLEGRFADTGVYYRVKLEGVPRQKDSSLSNEYLRDAYLGWNKFSLLDLRFGRFVVPESRSQLHSAATQYTPYRPLLNVIALQRYVGAQAALSDPWHAATFTAGVFNSVSNVSQAMRDTAQLLYVARLEVAPHNLLKALEVSMPEWTRFKGSLAGSYAYTANFYDTAAAKPQHRWLGVDGAFTFWYLSVEGEWLLHQFFTGTEADRGDGFHVDLVGHVWPGVLDLVLRVEQSDFDREENGYDPGFNPEGLLKQGKRWITAGINFFAFDDLKLQIHYLHRQELEGYDLDNDMLVCMLQFAL